MNPVLCAPWHAAKALGSGIARTLRAALSRLAQLG
jgi:hypothetical protein